MGVLDELKKEAEAARAREEREKSSTEQERIALERKLLTRLDDLYHYFKEFHGTVSEVNPDIAVNMDVEGFGTLEGLKQGEYKIATDDPEDVRKFMFHFKLIGEGRRELKFANRALAQKQKEYMWNANLRFQVRDTSGGGSTIVFDPVVPVSFEFAADVEKQAVRLRVKNMPRLGPYTYNYAPEQVNGEFMDEVAKYILRKESRFDELSGNTLSEETRMKLRQQLQEKPAPAAEDQEEKEKKGLGSKFKSVLTSEIKLRK